jgi:hypothetical protein
VLEKCVSGMFDYRKKRRAGREMFMPLMDRRYGWKRSNNKVLEYSVRETSNRLDMLDSLLLSQTVEYTSTVVTIFLFFQQSTHQVAVESSVSHQPCGTFE